jgi:hypothetical protein
MQFKTDFLQVHTQYFPVLVRYTIEGVYTTVLRTALLAAVIAGTEPARLQEENDPVAFTSAISWHRVQ